MFLYLLQASLGLVLFLVMTAFSPATGYVVVEDWEDDFLGATGIPVGWTGQGWGFPDYDMTIVADEGRKRFISKVKMIARRSIKRLKDKWTCTTSPSLNGNGKQLHSQQVGIRVEKKGSIRSLSCMYLGRAFPGRFVHGLSAMSGIPRLQSERR